MPGVLRSCHALTSPDSRHRSVHDSTIIYTANLCSVARLMVSLIIHLILRPYDTQPGRREGETDCQHERLKLKGIFSENVFEPLVLFVLSMSFMVLRFSTLDVNDTNFFVWFVMVVNTCVLIRLLAGILYRRSRW